MRLERLMAKRWSAPVACLVWGQWEVWVSGPRHLVGPRWALAAASAVAAAALWWRTEWPVAVTVAVAAAVVPGMVVWGASESTAPLVPGVVAVYSAARYGRRPHAHLALVVSMLVILLQQARDPLIEDLASSWSWTLVSAVPWGVGVWLRQRHALEQQRAAEAEERVRAATAEERVRIARDVHDVLAHSIGVMVVQAEAASELLAVDPARAERPVRVVHETGRRAMQEVRSMLEVLRQGDHALAPPASTLGDVAALVVRLRDAGVPVELVCAEAEVPARVAAAAYRIVQEALTNVLRHAGHVRTVVTMSAADGRLLVAVENDGRRVEPGASGHGIVGMRERVAALGGRFVAAPRPEGGFAVRAVLPLEA